MATRPNLEGVPGLHMLRPGDLLTDSAFSDWREDAQSHNILGALVGACNPSATVYVGWTMPFLRESILRWRDRHYALLFGHENDVRQSFMDIHDRIGISIVHSRCMIFPGAKEIIFAYPSDNLSGFSFDSVWIVGEHDGAERRERERAAVEARWRMERQEQDRIAARIRLAEERLRTQGEVRQVQSGYRGAVRAQYVSTNLQTSVMDMRVPIVTGGIVGGVPGRDDLSDWVRLGVITEEQARQMMGLNSEPSEPQPEPEPKLVEFPSKRVILDGDE